MPHSLQPPQVLDQLWTSSSADQQLRALKTIIGDVVGNILHKELWVHHGVLDALVGLLGGHGEDNSGADVDMIGDETGAVDNRDVLKDEAESEVKATACALLATLARGLLRDRE